MNETEFNQWKEDKLFGKERMVAEFARNYMLTHTNLPYHNFDVHIIDVVDVATNLARLEGVERSNVTLLVTAALMHDLIYKVGSASNEENSADYAKSQIANYGYTNDDILKIYSMIMSTKLPTTPRNLLERIICDADLDSLGRPDFREKDLALMAEFGVKDQNDWYERKLIFLKSHKYYTESAKRLRYEGVQKNIALIEGILAPRSKF